MKSDYQKMLEYIYISPKIRDELIQLLKTEKEYRYNTMHIEPLNYNSIELFNSYLVEIAFEYLIHKKYSLLTHLKQKENLK